MNDSNLVIYPISKDLASTKGWWESFACLQFYKHTCQSIFAGNICSYKQVKIQ